MLGCFDTKGEDFKYLYTCLSNLGATIISINTGVQDTLVDFPITISAEQVAGAANCSLESLRKKADRNLVVEKMGQGAAAIIADLVAQGRVKGAIGMGV